MAVKDWSILKTFVQDRRCKVIHWNLTAGDTPLPFVVAEHKDKTVLFEGNFGTGSMALAGTPNPDPIATVDTPTNTAAMYTLHEANSGTAISSVTSARVYCVLEHVFQIVPVITGNITNIDVYLITGDS